MKRILAILLWVNLGLAACMLSYQFVYAPDRAWDALRFAVPAGLILAFGWLLLSSLWTAVAERRQMHINEAALLLRRDATESLGRNITKEEVVQMLIVFAEGDGDWRERRSLAISSLCDGEPQ